MASLTPLRFGWTQDRGNGKNLCRSSPCPQPTSIALVVDGCNMGLITGPAPSRFPILFADFAKRLG